MDRFEPGRPERNSPFAIVGVLTLVLGLVVGIALAGRVVRPIRGMAVAAPGVLADGAGQPSAGSPPRSAEPRPVVELGANPLLADGVTLPRITCTLPELGRSGAQVRRYYDAALGCLDDAWRPVLAAAHEPFAEAGLNIAADADSSCGDMPAEEEATAFYCAADEVIYMPRRRLLEYLEVYEPAHLAVLAHEYAHHVQNLSGILEAASRRLFGAEEGGQKELLVTRRIELQANCFAGLFLAGAAGRGSLPWSEAQAAVNDFRNSVDSDTHGTLENQVRWAERGFEEATTAACDTWDVPARDVA
ncbi:neutral zinc metallopeptidase [Prauserella muralis]|uniref:neutral zinc metallopeptidase n=1 Tax=Prauserella muralis TaxID=588067 RepID=UPI000DD4737E|nr:neutral zinc metallopeptidase [Prauserella muralis]TWE29554.1 hypothetical protein FHX69_2239 [Prauserella muralis]